MNGRLIIDNDVYDDGDVLVKYQTPFGDPFAEQRHEDIFRTFYGVFRQWFERKHPINGADYIARFGEMETVNELPFPLTDEAHMTIQRLAPDEQNAFTLTLFAFYDFLNKTEQLTQTKVVKIDVSRLPIEFWFNFRKADLDEAIPQLAPLIEDVKALSSMLIEFINSYGDLGQHPIWRILYTFIMINMINVIDRLTFRPNMRSIGAFVNITDEIEKLME